MAVREVTVPLRAAIANSVVDFSTHAISLVAVETDIIRDGRPVTGLAFNSIGRFAQGGLLRDRLVPRLTTADPDDLMDPRSGLLSPERVLRVMLRNEKQGGHGDRAHAAAAVELACWDAVAKVCEEPAWHTISRHFGGIGRGYVPAYAAGGYYGTNGASSALAEEIQAYLDQGFRAVKIKVRGADLTEDLQRIDLALSKLETPGQLAVDLNGSLEPMDATRYAKELEVIGLRWLEEPVPPLDFRGYAQVAASTRIPIATGENLFSVDDVKNLMQFSGLRPDRDILQMDAGLSYGLTEYVKMISLALDHGFPRESLIPHGGQLMNLHIVAGLGLGGCEAYPGVFQPAAGFSPECELKDGVIHVGEAPGFGLEAKQELRGYISELTV